jgi:uncharacterized protein YukE
MGLFDMYGDLMEKVGETMQRADPFGPVGAAGEMISGLFGAADLISEHGPDALWNLAGDFGEVASVALVLLPAAKQTDIISAGLKTVLGLQLQCGWTNAPEDGDGYSQSAQQFNLVADGLETAFPDDRWQGDAADAYSEANKSQKDRARRMPDADLDVLMAISSEAGAVNTTRRILNNAATLMGNAIVPALAARSIPRVGKAMSLEIEMAAVGVSIPTCLWYVNELSNHSERSAQAMKDAARIYDEIAAECYPTRM